jgi:beta-glucanase (GH16 family)
MQNAKNPYKSARLVTKGKQHFQYGRIEVRARLASGRGIWPAIWMLGTNIKEAGWPLCGEIDIMEHVGYMPDSIFASVHTESYNHVKGTQKTKGIYLADPYTDFHTYSIEWDAEQISFFLNQQLYLQFRNEHNTVKEWPFSQPFFLLLNVAVGGNWGAVKGIDPDIFPATMEVDYVRVYTK